MKKFHLLAILLFFIAFTSHAQVTTNFSGSLTNALTYTRPDLVVDNSGDPNNYIRQLTVADLKAGSATYNYFAQSFTPSVTGTYTSIKVNSATFPIDGNGNSDDSYLYVYTGSFNPSSPLTNMLKANDDQSNVIVRSEVTGVTLTAGVTYFIVLTSYEAGQTGPLSFSITGPGGVTVGITTVSSITRASINPTNQSAVNYTTTFAGSVTGVDASDFTLISTSTATGTIGTPTGSGGTWNVPITSISGDGTLKLNFTGLTGVMPNVSTAYTTGEVYTIDHTLPTISTVSSTALNGTYIIGNTIPITVAFSENVIVTGTPVIALNAGGTASYASGSGTSTLTFNYVVGTGNNSLDLDYISTASLTLAGGTIKDAATNNATLTLPTIGGPSSIGGQKNIIIDGLAPTITSVAVPANGTYKIGQNLDFTLNLSEAVVVNTGGGTPYTGLTLNTGGTVQAAYLSGSGTSALTFRYTIVTGNADNDGVVLATAATLNGGTLKDAAGNNLSLTLVNTGATTGILLDGTAPAVNSITRVGAASSNAASVDYTVTFSEPVTGVDITDFTATTTGSAAGTIATLTPVSGSVYTVTVNTITGAGTLRLDLKNTGTGIADAATNTITAGYTSGQVYTIDRIAPIISTAGLPANATYTAGQNLDFTLNFNEAVTVAGSPQLGLTLNTGGTVQAAYLSGSGSAALTFRYTVAAGNIDNDGITLDAAAALNGGTIQDAVTNNALLTLNGVPSTAAILIDAAAPAITSVGIPANATYGTGQNLDFSVNLTEPVTVNTSGGIPSIGITLNTGGTVQAAYVSGSGTAALIFRYTVAAGNADNDGIVLATAITLNGGTLKDAAGNNLGLTLISVGATNAINVDGTAPAVSSIARVGGAGLTNAASINYTLTFSENVTGFDTGDLTLTATGTAAGNIASITPVSGSVYTVTVNTITGAGTLRLDLNTTGTGITDLAANPISGGFNIGEVYTIDRTIPVVTSVNVPANATYAAGQSLDFILNYNKNVTVTGTPQLGLTLTTGGTVQASYLSGSGTSALTFRYTVNTGDQDNDGITLATAATLNGGTIMDNATNPAILTLNSVAATTGILIDAIVPTISSVSLPANATYGIGQNLDFTVNLTENTIINTTGGTPSIGITLNTGGTVQAAYLSGSSTAALVFRYIVAAGNADNDGIVLAPAIALNGGTLKDAAGNDLSLTLNNAGSTAAVNVDGALPAVNSIARVTAATTNAASVDYTLTFSKNITGFDIGDLTLTTTGTANGNIASITPVSGSVYTVTVNTITGAGTLRLDLNNTGTGITDLASNPINGGFNTGEIYTIDRVIPVITSVNVPATATYTAGQNLDFTLNFNKNVTVTGTPQLGLTLNTGGTVQAAYLAGSGTTALTFRYTVNAGDLDNDGITLAAAATLNGGTIVDNATNPAILTLNSVSATTGILIDAVAPIITTVSVPANATYGIGQNLDFTVNLTENTIINTTGGTPSIGITLNTGAIVQAIYLSGSGTASLVFRYIIAAGNADNDGIVLASAIALNGGTLKDAAGNDLVLTLNNAGSTAAVNVDGALPAVNSIARVTAAKTNAASVDYTLTFSENVTGFDTGDLTLTTTGTANGTIAAITPVSGSVYTVTVNTITGAGTLRLDLENAGTGITDLGSNPISGGFTTGEVYTIDRTIPTLSAVNILSNNIQPTKAKTGDIITLTFVSSEAIQSPVVTINGNSPTSLNATGDNWTATYTLTANDTEGLVPFNISFNDLANNAGSPVTTGTGSVSFDKTLPAIPTGLAATPGDTQVQLSWNANTDTDLASYRILFGTGPEPTATLTNIPAGTTTYSHTGLTNGTTYYYKIQAFDQNGNSSAASADVIATPKANQTITFNPITAKTYGDADFSLGAANSSAALPITYTAADPSLVLITGNLAKILKAGSTIITASQPGNGTFNPATAVQRTLTVTQKALTITASNQTKTYGDAVTFTGTEFTSAGLINSDIISSVSITSTGAAATATVAGSPYAVIPTAATGTGLSNYTLSYVNGNLTVNRKGLIITADNKEKFAGTANPPLTATITGFANNENGTVFSVQPALTTAAVLSSSIGTYPITAGSAAAANYTISYVSGTLTIKAGAPTDISFAAATLYENQPSGTNAGTLSATSDDPAATFSYSLISGAGDTDNSLFSISGTQVLTTGSTNYEQKAVYNIRVRVNTQYGFTLDKTFSINLSDVNETPTLDAIVNQALCYTTTRQELSLTGISTGPETAQNTTITAASSTDLLQNITVTKNGAANATLSYRIKDGAAGTATITVTVKDNGGTANGGIDTYTSSFTVTVNALPVIAISADLGTEISKGKTVRLTATGGTTYSWSTNSGIISGQQTAILTVRPSVTTTYTVTVTNASGCSEQKTITLNVLDDYKTLDATNIITPNGDGQNDFWIIRNIDLYPNNEVKVFDKAGRIVFSQKHYQNTWDATVNGSPLSEGTYYYIVDFGEGKGRLKGFITVIRRQ